MKRYFCLILVLMVVPVLPIGAAAAEIYEFEYMEPVALYGEQFDFSLVDGSQFFCESIIPPGTYVLHYKIMTTDEYITGVSEPFTVSFVPFTEDGVSYDLCQTSVQVCLDFKCVMSDVLIGTGEIIGGSLLSTTFSVGPESFFILEAVDGQSDFGDIGLSGFLDSVSSGLIEYSTSNLVLIIVAGLILACSPLLAWFAYRFIKRKVTKSVFKGRL